MKKLLLLPIIFFVFACSSDEMDENEDVIETTNESKLFGQWDIKSVALIGGESWAVPDELTTYNLNLNKNGTYTWGMDFDGVWNKMGSFLLTGDDKIIFQRMVDTRDITWEYKFSLDNLILEVDYDYNPDEGDIDYFVLEKK